MKDDQNHHPKNSPHKKELEQERILFSEIQKTLSDKVKELENTKQELEEQIATNFSSFKELQQEKIMLDEKVKSQVAKTQVMTRKYYLAIALAGVVLVAIIIPYSLYVVTLVGQEYMITDLGQVKSNYVIQNLKGDIITTWLSWRLTEGDTLYVNIVDASKYPEEAEMTKNTILSTEVFEIDDSLTDKGPKGSTSLYYSGWAGALEKSSQTPTTFYIPKKLEFVDSNTGAGDITIKFVSYRDGDGYAGFTKSIVDDNQNQILKSEITIYDIDNLSNEKLSTLIRHEFGHALGLAHSTAPDDLMAPIVTTKFPYISECDIDAIVSLYDVGKLSVVVCEK